MDFPSTFQRQKLKPPSQNIRVSVKNAFLFLSFPLPFHPTPKYFMPVYCLNIVEHRCNWLPFRNSLLLTQVIHYAAGFSASASTCYKDSSDSFLSYTLSFNKCSRTLPETRLLEQAIAIAFSCRDSLSAEQAGLSRLLDCWHFANVTSRAAE